MRNVKRILVHLKSGSKYLVKELHDDYHTQNGVVKASDFRKASLESSTGEKFLCLEPNFIDLWENLKRGPQIITQKDIGLILAKTGVNSKSKVVDAGGGSGSLCLALANVCNEVTTYEVNPEHYDVVSRNKQLLGAKNLIIKQANVYEGIKEKKLDLITLDLPEPWKVVEHAQDSLKTGGFLVVYLPNLNQMKMFIDSCRRTKIKVLDTLELLERKWVIEDRIMRPEFQMLGHTGFLTFCRRL
ncbi:MAG: methyltransferase domain-containing protein [Nanoarchaeota archaeon]|nr:methyltransferase domain-containing protein [Nanoarchaeota archaeon]MBU1974038.1 methyltransferase domain-containing protein [Nanoarchaeota archaeon]